MAYKEVQSLDADVVVALGKRDKKTGKAYPKTAEGYYLGSRTVQNKRGESLLHFLQTDEGNLGVWGTTDLNKKLTKDLVGTMIRVTSTGTKPTPNGDMYTYRVEVDSDNTIAVSGLAASAAGNGSDEEYVEDGDDDEDTDTEEVDSAAETEDVGANAQVQAQAAAVRRAKVDALLKSKRTAK